MPLKATLKPDHIPVNKYTLSIVGIIPLTFTSISGLEEEIDTVELPDRTKATGGNTKPVEITLNAPLHHTAENVALEAWYREAQDPVTSTYKKVATLTLQSGTGAIRRTFTLLGCWLSKRKTPDLEMENEGDMAVVEWTMQIDQVVPVPA